MSGLCCLNGEFIPLEAARVSPMDRGFLFGDGVYEVVPAYGRKLFLWTRHMARLRRSLAGIRLAFDDASMDALASAARKVVAAQSFSRQALYIQITRGAHPVRAHAFADDATPTVFIAAFPVKDAAETAAQGAACILQEDFRWLRGDLKTTSLLGATLLARAAKDAGVAEAILIRDGLVTEGSSTNVILARDGALFSPKFDQRVLRGVTCETALEVARGVGIRTENRDIRRAELFAADELWLTSSTREIAPVVELDGAPIGAGRPGEMFAKVNAAFQQFKTEHCESAGK